jgi:hypothetical protein
MLRRASMQPLIARSIVVMFAASVLGACSSSDNSESHPPGSTGGASGDGGNPGQAGSSTSGGTTNGLAGASGTAGLGAGGSTRGAGGSSGASAGGSSGAAAGGSGGVSAGGSGGAGAGGSSGGSAGSSSGGMTGRGTTCGDATCGENQYCRAGCCATAGCVPGGPQCEDLPAACDGVPSCQCICGSGSGLFCKEGAPQVQCGCA